MEDWDIEARGLTKKFGSFTAVCDQTLRVPRAAAMPEPPGPPAR